MKRHLPSTSVERIENCIYTVRDQRVMLDDDLSRIYGVKTKVLNQAVKRNADRFPEDFAFQLTRQEVANLRSQTVTSSYGGRRYLPWAFTEHGAIMAATVLSTPMAVCASVQVVRVFVRLRQLLVTNADLAQKLEELEKKYDAQFRVVFEAIRQLMAPPEPPKKSIGFHVKESRSLYRM